MTDRNKVGKVLGKDISCLYARILYMHDDYISVVGEDYKRMIKIMFADYNLKSVEVYHDRSLIAKLSWSRRLVGARIEGSKLALYADNDGFLEINMRSGTISGRI